MRLADIARQLLTAALTRPIGDQARFTESQLQAAQPIPERPGVLISYVGGRRGHKGRQGIDQFAGLIEIEVPLGVRAFRKPVVNVRSSRRGQLVREWGR